VSVGWCVWSKDMSVFTKAGDSHKVLRVLSNVPVFHEDRTAPKDVRVVVQMRRRSCVDVLLMCTAV
jgi:hypothetical protein